MTTMINTKLKSYMDFWERLDEVFVDLRIIGGRTMYSKKAIRLNRVRTVTWRITGVKIQFWNSVFKDSIPDNVTWSYRRAGGGTLVLQVPMSAEEMKFFERWAANKMEVMAQLRHAQMLGEAYAKEFERFLTTGYHVYGDVIWPKTEGT